MLCTRTVQLLEADGKPASHDENKFIFYADDQQLTPVLEFSLDGCMIAAGGTGGLMQFWATAVTDPMPSEGLFEAHSERITCIAWSPDCKRMAVGTAEGTVSLWCLVFLDKLYEWKCDGRKSSVTSLNFFGRNLYPCRDEESLCVYRVQQDVVFDELDATWGGRLCSEQ